MPALDKCHDQTIRALEKAGWHVVNEHVRLVFGNRSLYADLLVEHTSLGQVAIVEIKCDTTSKEALQEVYRAIGQYLVYRELALRMEMQGELYLSFPVQLYARLFNDALEAVFRKSGIKLVLVDFETGALEWRTW